MRDEFIILNSLSECYTRLVR